MRRYDGTNVGGDDVINLPVDYGAEHKAPLKGKRVLIVEDEYFQADELMRAIQAAGGLVVGPFAQTSEAAEALTENVGLAVLDVWVRDGATYPLATQLRERGIPFVFATGHGSNTGPSEWQSSSWITKPYECSEVVRWLVNAVS